MPVDPLPPVAVAVPLPHTRKLAFVLGALLTWALIVMAQKLTGLG